MNPVGKSTIVLGLIEKTSHHHNLKLQPHLLYLIAASKHKKPLHSILLKTENLYSGSDYAVESEGCCEVGDVINEFATGNLRRY